MSERLTSNAPDPERYASDGIDYYKFTMGQLALKKFSDVDVEFTFKNRNKERLLSEYVGVDELKNRLDEIRERGFTPEEIAYFAGLEASDGSARFDEEYLDFLADLQLTDVNVGIDDETGELAVSASGQWANASLWETIIMSEVNEIYYKNYMQAKGIDINEVYAEGDRRLDEKIAILEERPDIKFADFGTRRRFSPKWHEHVVKRLKKELPENFIGTSNPWYAHKYDIKPIGTYAHEMPMVYAALSDAENGKPLEGHRKMMDDWYDEHGPDLSIALTDTFTSKFFFEDFTPEQAQKYRGLRHDSGDPIEFGEQAIAFYKKHGIDPTTKEIVFSNSLNTEKVIELADYFGGRVGVVIKIEDTPIEDAVLSIKHSFGIGQHVTNDLGLPPTNNVMKATRANGIPTVKLSDDEGKHTGSAEKIEFYKNHVANAVND